MEGNTSLTYLNGMGQQQGFQKQQESQEQGFQQQDFQRTTITNGELCSLSEVATSLSADRIAEEEKEEEKTSALPLPPPPSQPVSPEEDQEENQAEDDERVEEIGTIIADILADMLGIHLEEGSHEFLHTQREKFAQKEAKNKIDAFLEAVRPLADQHGIKGPWIYDETTQTIICSME